MNTKDVKLIKPLSICAGLVSQLTNYKKAKASSYNFLFIDILTPENAHREDSTANIRALLDGSL